MALFWKAPLTGSISTRGFVNWCEVIADALPPNYEAGLGERVYLVEHDPEARKLGIPRCGCPL